MLHLVCLICTQQKCKNDCGFWGSYVLELCLDEQHFVHLPSTSVTSHYSSDYQIQSVSTGGFGFGLCTVTMSPNQATSLQWQDLRYSVTVPGCCL